MTKYDVHVICDQCGQPHPVNVSLDLDDETLNKTPLADHFAGRTLPAAIAFMQTNKYRCPHTKQLFPASDISKAILFAA
ncbi:MAG: hypothetical protein KA746_05380 [Pyrinomonadaceae bacterium]|nr:hypothetical protein [Pyrinomonadaceae bacterium]MBP6212824.1 hypothetical protein [Pyrinomonadaceae bacterium]